jgi:signal transduction histidine kinase
MKDILQLSKPSPARFTKISVSELLLKAIEMYQLKNPAAKALIETHFQESLSFMYGDLHKLHQVLYNLLENAFFASGNSKKITVKAFMETVQISDLVSERETKRTSDPPHSRFFHLRRSAFLIQKKLSSLSKDGDTMVILEITDSGTGIPEEILGKIFDPFFTTKLQKGTGLGLAIVQSIIKRHHGAIDVVSEPGKGTTLFLKFPVYEDVIRFERML